MRKINLCHLYNKATSSTHIDKILNSFEDSVSASMESGIDVDKYDVFIIESEISDSHPFTEIGGGKIFLY